MREILGGTMRRTSPDKSPEPGVGTALTALKPEGLVSADASWQERKRSEFRVVVLEAVVDCLAEHGYARTTTEMVAAKARVSRGTMLHRFPTRQSLIEAAIDYAFFRRMQDFLAAIEALTEEQRVQQNLGITLSARQYFTREYRAYLELHIAARTDAELRAFFLPRARQYDEIWHREVGKAFPEWGHNGELIKLSCEFVRSSLEGLALNKDVWDSPERYDTLVQFVADTAIALREGKLKFRT
jgi:AcrR family transcriptional regulator